MTSVRDLPEAHKTAIYWRQKADSRDPVDILRSINLHWVIARFSFLVRQLLKAFRDHFRSNRRAHL
jgi:hypothetical protein